jgi:hypothetical protein
VQVGRCLWAQQPPTRTDSNAKRSGGRAEGMSMQTPAKWLTDKSAESDDE